MLRIFFSSSSVFPAVQQLTSITNHSPLQGSTFLKAEWARMLQGEEMATLDMSRYKPSEPAGPAQGDAAAWQVSVQNVQRQVQHHHLRLENLELMSKYGSDAWMAHNQTLDESKTGLEAIVEAYKTQVDAVNRKRQADQEKVGEELRSLDYQWQVTVDRMHSLRAACDSLNGQIKKAKTT
jgi:pre-mRNA-splicing factor SPF27